jgi:hypothetical protein
MGGIWAIISGDATHHSFEYINGYFNVQFDPNINTLLPHHASRKTTFGLDSTDQEISKKAKKVVETFAKNMNGRTVVASADTSHGHPSLETIELFLQYTDPKKIWWKDPKLGDFHYVTANIDINIKPKGGTFAKKNYTTYQTGENVYSTLYFNELADPAFSYPPYQPLDKKKRKKSTYIPSEGMNWIYTSNGTLASTTLVGKDSERLDALTEMLLRADLSSGLPRPALAAPAPLTATVSVRQGAPGVPRPAIAPPRSASAFSRLVRVL